MTLASRSDGGIAIVGMAGRFPGGRDVAGLWDMLMSGTEAVRRFGSEELAAAGVPDSLISDPNYVPFGGDLPGIDLFDAEFFGIPAHEARLVDPQHRIFLECVWSALEDAGTPPTAHGGRIGVFGSTSSSSYLLNNVLRSEEFLGQEFSYPVHIGNDKDFLATRVSFRLNLTGPSITVQTACSSSLVAVDWACQSLTTGGCDVAVAGGVSVSSRQPAGYLHQEGGTFSRDGHCRPFDIKASGMVSGSGCGVVVLKRLADAIADRDQIYAVIAASAVNNDGAAKMGFTAPGVTGQVEVIQRCLADAAIPASAIGYVEAHGTGTFLGDPIEITALHQAYRAVEPPRSCGVGSIKANIGHLDAAAGIAGLIKAALVIKHQVIPPQINYTAPNPELRLHTTPFTIHTEPHRPPEPIRAAAVTALGIGGTNAHCILTPPPQPHRQPPQPGPYVLRLSATDEAELRVGADALLAYLEATQPRVDDVAFTLATGRSPMPNRAAIVVHDLHQARESLEVLRDGDAVKANHPAVSAWVETGTVDGDGDALAAAVKIPIPGRVWRRRRHWIDPAPVPSREVQTSPGTADPVDTATAVAEVYAALLHRPAVRSEDDFLALGGDSLLAVEAAAHITQRLGSAVTPAQLLAWGTPQAIADQLARSSHGDAGRTMTTVKDGPPGNELFLVHPSGGTDFFAHQLAAHSSNPDPIFAFSYPLSASAELQSIHDMARHYLAQIREIKPHGPYRLGGYSLGGMIALEMSLQLERIGVRVAQLILFDTLPPDAHAPAPGDDECIAAFPDLLRVMLNLPAGPKNTPPRTVDDAINAVRQPSWTEQTITELKKLYEVWRICGQALSNYRPTTYAGDVVLFAARAPLPDTGQHLNLTPYSMQDWRNYLTGNLQIVDVPGDHFSMFAPEHAPRLAAAYDKTVCESAAGSRTRRRPVALMFPGQGSQHIGMGANLFPTHPDLVGRADEILGYSIEELCLRDPHERLDDTRYTQPAIYVVNALHYQEYVRNGGAPPVAVLGHSLGEYNALHAAGVVSFDAGLRLVVARAQAMAKVANGGMLVVSGLSQVEIVDLLATPPFHDVDLAAINTIDQHTLAGPHSAIDSLAPILRELGARTVQKLRVSGPFHSRYMRPAARDLSIALSQTALRTPEIPVIANTTALPHTNGQIATELTRQIEHPVLWEQSVRYTAKKFEPRFIELGDKPLLQKTVHYILHSKM